jgi:hypothetical protein
MLADYLNSGGFGNTPASGNGNGATGGGSKGGGGGGGGNSNGPKKTQGAKKATNSRRAGNNANVNPAGNGIGVVRTSNPVKHQHVSPGGEITTTTTNSAPDQSTNTLLYIGIAIAVVVAYLAFR